MSKKDMAVEKHKNGYNCAQCLCCVYGPELGFSEEDIFRITEGFGFGMGSMSTCGVVSAMAVIAGMKNSDGKLGESKTKKSTYKIVKEMTEAFLKENGTTVCKELKGVGTGSPVKSCDRLIEDGSDIIEKFLFD